MEQVFNCVVARKKDENGKPYLAAYLQVNGDSDFGQIIADIKRNIFKYLNKYSLPTKYIKVSEIKKTKIGKNDFIYYENNDE
jgi:predicted methyltransferase